MVRLSSWTLWRLVIVVAVLASAGQLAGGRARAVGAAPLIRRMPLPVRLFEPPAVHGNTVAWATEPGHCHTSGVPAAGSICLKPIYLHVANLRHFRPRTIAQLPRGTSYVDVQMSGRYLVWLTFGESMRGWRIDARDLATGRQWRVASSRTEMGFAIPSYPSISLHGTDLAWVQHECTDNCLRNRISWLTMENLETGRRSQVTSEAQPCTTLGGPFLTGTTIAWTRDPIDVQGCAGGSRVHVFVMNRATGVIRLRTVDPGPGKAVVGMSANDRFLAWAEETLHTDRDVHVMLMNIGTGKVTRVTSRGADDPMLDDHLLVWYGDYRGAIEVLDLRTWRYVRLTGPQRSQRSVVVASSLSQPTGMRVAWNESSSTAADVHWTNRLAVADVP
jgi:hypothetical protein